MIETVKISEKGKTQLVTLKRRTGLQNWNVLCRWAFCMSLAEASRPPDENILTDSSVEMTWKTFTGGRDELYWGLLTLRAKRDGVSLDKESLAKYFKLHLHRGIAYLNASSSTKSIDGLVTLALKQAPGRVATPVG
jgi:DNA sulfur modification protein DndE